MSAATGTPSARASRSISRQPSRNRSRIDGSDQSRTDRQPRCAGEAGERHEKDELLPDRHAAVLDRFSLNVGRNKRLLDGAHARRQARQRAEDFTKDDAAMSAGLFDDAWRGERRCDVSGATEDRRLAVP